MAGCLFMCFGSNAEATPRMEAGSSFNNCLRLGCRIGRFGFLRPAYNLYLDTIIRKRIAHQAVQPNCSRHSSLIPYRSILYNVQELHESIHATGEANSNSKVCGPYQVFSALFRLVHSAILYGVQYLLRTTHLFSDDEYEYRYVARWP